MVVTVTGSTGTIGTELMELLSRAEVPSRGILRDFTRARPLDHVVWIQADLREETALEPALAGTRRLFLLTDNQPGFGATQIGALRAAERCGVEHVVKLSALGASGHSRAGLGREHWDVEQALRASSMTWTILRPHSFMQNWLDDVAGTIRREGVVRAAIGDGRVPFIDARDIAAVAAEALRHPDAHAGRRYVLTGGEAIGYADLADAASEVLGKTVTYEAVSMDEERRRMERQGVPGETIDSLLAIAAYQKAGGPAARVSEDVQQVLGRPPRTVRDFVRDHRARFGAEPRPRSGTD